MNKIIEIVYRAFFHSISTFFNVADKMYELEDECGKSIVYSAIKYVMIGLGYITFGIFIPFLLVCGLIDQYKSKRIERRNKGVVNE